MTNSVSISATYADGKPLSVLNDLIAKRERFLRGETTEKAVISTTINVLSSLKPQVKVARKQAVEADYKIEWIGHAGWRGGNGSRRRTPVSNGHRIPGIFPVNNMYKLTGSGDVYKITLTNRRIWPKKAKNAPFYYIMAPNMTVAANFAAARVNRALNRERGLARGVIGYAQAKVSDRPMSETGAAMIAKGALIATAAAVTTGGDGFSSGNFWLEFHDKLDYSMSALERGSAALDYAMMKAANRTAAIINKLGQARLDEKIPTPFPEVAGKKH